MNFKADIEIDTEITIKLVDSLKESGNLIEMLMVGYVCKRISIFFSCINRHNDDQLSLNNLKIYIKSRGVAKIYICTY